MTDLNREGLEAAKRAIPAGHGQAWVYAEAAIRAYLAHAKPDTAALVDLRAALERIAKRAIVHPSDDLAECKRQMFHIEGLARAALSTVPAKSVDHVGDANEMVGSPPAPAEVGEGLRRRCAEIVRWRDTGKLEGDALRTFAAEKFSAFGDEAVRKAEDATLLELCRIAARPTSEGEA